MLTFQIATDKRISNVHKAGLDLMRLFAVCFPLRLSFELEKKCANILFVFSFVSVVLIVVVVRFLKVKFLF